LNDYFHLSLSLLIPNFKNPILKFQCQKNRRRRRRRRRRRKRRLHNVLEGFLFYFNNQNKI
jgi:hypothetical protein